MSKISRNIKKLRTASGLTQEELAGKIHVTRQTVSSWETDRTQPDLELLQNIAEVFGVEPEEIIYGKKRNTAEEKEKQLFGNTLITVLSVLGCLLIGAGVVMVFINWWQDFPDVLKLLTCFIPALAGQGFGIYTYIKKRGSRAWCEGASVLWMLGVGVTTAIITNIADYRFVETELVFIFLAAGFLMLMLLFGTISPLPVVQALSVFWLEYALSSMRLYSYSIKEMGIKGIMMFLTLTLMEVAFVGIAVYSSKKLANKDGNPHLGVFCQWVNLAAVVAVAYIVLERTYIEGGWVSLAVAVAIVFFAVGVKEKDGGSPYKVLGLPLTAATLCAFSLISALDVGVSTKWGSLLIIFICMLPMLLFLHEKTRPENVYLRAYGILATTALLVFNIVSHIFLLKSLENEGAGFYFESNSYQLNWFLTNVNFPVCLAGLIMLVIYGAKERKLLYLNLGFVLSCVSVVMKLYYLDMGLIATGVMLIVCGAALLFVNLKYSRLREKEKLALLEEGEEEAQ